MSTQRFNQDRQREYPQVSAACQWDKALVEHHQKGEVLNNIGRFFTVDLLVEEMKHLNPHAATGIDKVTLKDLRMRQQTEIPTLVNQVRGRTYKCQPNRRAEIRKSDGTPRHLGIQCMRDKLAGAGIKAIFEPVCEAMFSKHSYAYRPGLGCHHALADLENRIVAMQGGFILDLDIEKFFDRVNHSHLMRFIRAMVSDPIILHAIHEFLIAGTLVRDGSRGEMHLVRAGQGTPQGGVTSPLLSNIYLHHAFDTYLTNELSPSIPGGVSFVRYADDIVCLVKDADCANRVRDSINKRLGLYDIPLHPLKSKTLDFRRPDLALDDTGFEKSGFDFLGFRVEWEFTPSGTWRLVKKVANGRTERAVERSRAVFMRRQASGASFGELCEGIRPRVKGFNHYFRFEGCRDGVTTYFYELCKLMESLRFTDDSDQSDEVSHSSSNLPVKFSGRTGARHA